jgi:predicted nucleic acid-binding protein
MIVLDTNVLSELMRPSPSTKVDAWASDQASSNLYTTAVTQAEILHGVMLMPAGKRREAIQAAAERMFAEDFADRVLSFDSQAAAMYAEIATARRRSGKPISQFDAQIAAIVRSHGARLATRNVEDFGACGIKIVNPWA